MFIRLLGYAIMLFLAAWLVVSAIELIESVITPLAVAGGVIALLVICYRVLERKNRW